MLMKREETRETFVLPVAAADRVRSGRDGGGANELSRAILDARPSVV
jgi:hypothetical protein